MKHLAPYLRPAFTSAIFRPLLLLCVASAFLFAAGAVEPPPNIVILLADDLGVNDLGCYGRKDQRTPHLDRLALDGARFMNAYAAASVCSPSRAALMTGHSPARLNLTTFIPGRSDRSSHRLLKQEINPAIPAGVKTLPELLKPAGYVTAAVGKWHLGGQGQQPTDRGFDEYHPGEANPGPESSLGGKGELGHADWAVDFIGRNAGKPFLLFVGFHNPHVPVAAHPQRVAAHAGAFNPINAAMVESLDEAVGRILNALEKERIARNTLVVFTSDNGGLHVPEANDAPPTHNSPFRAGKGFLYEGGLRVPLILRWPERINRGEIAAPAVLGDLCPTLCALAKVPGPTVGDFQDLTPLLLTGAAPGARTLTWHQPHYMNQGGRPGGALREGDWKLVEHYEDGSLELFNLATDPGETQNLAFKEPARVADLRGKLEAWRRSVGARLPLPNPDFDRAAWEACYVATDPAVLQPAATAESMRGSLAAWRAAMDERSRVSEKGPNPLIFLEARDAHVVGDKLRYENPPQKDTLGVWVNPSDTASWSFNVSSPGQYRVSILQGCGKSQGGSTVALEAGTDRCEFTVVETGHFQHFVAREVGRLRLAAGQTTLTVRPVEKKAAAVMDLRRVTLERIQ